MTFQITALDPAPYAALFGLDDAALAAHGARRVVADAKPGFPCRASLADAEPGETLILVNYEHLRGNTPYRASHAVFFRAGVGQAHPAPDEIPEVLSCRLLSLRAYDAAALMIAADVVDGAALRPALEAAFADDRVAFVHLHNAKPGCFAAAVQRA